MAAASLPSKLVPARIVRVSQETPKVISLRLQAPPEYDWAPGQHLALCSATAEGPVGYYSIASAPRISEPGVLELAAAVGSLPPGVQAQEGSDVWISLPAGELTVGRLLNARALVLIGVGTGVAPLRAIVQDLAGRGGPSRLNGPSRATDLSRVTLLQGARLESELLFRDEFYHYAAQGMDYRPVLSRPDPTWAARTGWVQHHLEGLDMTASFRICGSQAMVKDVTVQLLDGGALLPHIDGEGY